jgi:hypothetical protein
MAALYRGIGFRCKYAFGYSANYAKRPRLTKRVNKRRAPVGIDGLSHSALVNLDWGA